MGWAGRGGGNPTCRQLADLLGELEGKHLAQYREMDRPRSTPDKPTEADVVHARAEGLYEGKKAVERACGIRRAG